MRQTNLELYGARYFCSQNFPCGTMFIYRGDFYIAEDWTQSCQKVDYITGSCKKFVEGRWVDETLEIHEDERSCYAVARIIVLPDLKANPNHNTISHE